MILIFLQSVNVFTKEKITRHILPKSHNQNQQSPIGYSDYAEDPIFGRSTGLPYDLENDLHIDL